MSAARARGAGLSGLADRFANYVAGAGASARLGGTNYGQMCENAVAFTHTSVRCAKCNGLGFHEIDRAELEQRCRQIEEASDKASGGRRKSPRQELREKLSRDSSCSGCKGTGFLAARAPKSKMDSLTTTVPCDSCKGFGRLKQHGNQHGIERLIAALGLDWCWTCDGNGYLLPVTARETGSSKKGRLPRHATDASVDGQPRDARSAESLASGDWVDESAWVEFAQMTRVHEELRRVDETSAAVLDRYYSAEGDRYAREPETWGRVFAVWPLTHAGKLLATEGARRSEALGSEFRLTALDRIAAERNREERSLVIDMRIRVLITRADREARQLVERAHEALGKAGL